MLRSGLLATTTLALCGTTAFGAGKTNYEEHVVPILRTHCGNCHNPDKSKGDLNVMTYAGLMAGGSSGAAVEAGAADGSRLYKLSAHLEEPKMPPSGTKIPAKDLEVLKQWINDGLLEKSGGQAKVSKKPKMDLTVASAAGGNKPAGPAPMPGRDYLMEPYVRTPRPGLAYSIASSPWGPLLAVGGQKQVLLLHADTLAVLGVLPFPEGQPYVVKFSRNGALVLAAGGVAGKQGKVVVYKVDTGERVIEVGDESDAVLAADISADQSMVAV
ncbi:MAG TPA: c-type cytochrome domain-containing protein, partial [Planctomycetia bacterium]|nr:c-type cytochrome domain-containing protein [Planctomycetia bacterium]